MRTNAVRPATFPFLAEQLQLAEQFQAGRQTMFAPQDLSGRYGCVVKPSSPSL
jgi:hypothetical protein